MVYLLTSLPQYRYTHTSYLTILSCKNADLWWVFGDMPFFKSKNIWRWLWLSWKLVLIAGKILSNIIKCFLISWHHAKNANSLIFKLVAFHNLRTIFCMKYWRQWYLIIEMIDILILIHIVIIQKNIDFTCVLSIKFRTLRKQQFIMKTI